MRIKWWRSREIASTPAVIRADDDGREMTRRAFAAARTPGAPALLAELERGWARQDGADQMHAYEITPDDAAFLRMMAGASFGPDSTVVMPSGKTITGAEMARWLAAQS